MQFPDCNISSHLIRRTLFVESCYVQVIVSSWDDNADVWLQVFLQDDAPNPSFTVVCYQMGDAFDTWKWWFGGIVFAIFVFCIARCIVCRSRSGLFVFPMYRCVSKPLSPPLSRMMCCALFVLQEDGVKPSLSCSRLYPVSCRSPPVILPFLRSVILLHKVQAQCVASRLSAPRHHYRYAPAGGGGHHDGVNESLPQEIVTTTEPIPTHLKRVAETLYARPSKIPLNMFCFHRMILATFVFKSCLQISTQRTKIFIFVKKRVAKKTERQIGHDAGKLSLY